MTAQPTPRNDDPPAGGPLVPHGTRVLNIEDGEPGTILNGYAFDPDEGGWTEYEVETARYIERWPRSEFILFSEFGDPDA
ncbi:MAG: hypothetical protein JW809_14825 [Pirellulales bacterium]|nr:hypothetical protein [Pirellulales bacterium]